MNAKSRIAIADWSTINKKRLALLPPLALPPTYHLDDDMGNGCAGDPPGYPTYFTRNVYTQYGNTPRRGARLVIGNRVVTQGDYNYEAVKKLLHRLWVPLPLDHPRTQAWILATFAHHRHCYHVPGTEALPHSDDRRMLIWPGGCLGKTPFGRLEDLASKIEWARQHESYDKWRAEEKNALEASIVMNNARITRECEAVAIPANATATGIIKRYYPEFEPTPDLFAEGLESPGYWWEVMAERPTPATCPGQYGQPHPVNTTWCQMCGYKST